MKRLRVSLGGKAFVMPIPRLANLDYCSLWWLGHSNGVARLHREFIGEGGTKARRVRYCRRDGQHRKVAWKAPQSGPAGWQVELAGGGFRPSCGAVGTNPCKVLILHHPPVERRFVTP
jgi:hypothetical protein